MFIFTRPILFNDNLNFGCKISELNARLTVRKKLRKSWFFKVVFLFLNWTCTPDRFFNSGAFVHLRVNCRTGKYFEINLQTN